MSELPWAYTQSWPFPARIADGKIVEVLALDLRYAWVSCDGHRPYTVRVEHIVGPPPATERQHAA